MNQGDGEDAGIEKMGKRSKIEAWLYMEVHVWVQIHGKSQQARASLTIKEGWAAYAPYDPGDLFVFDSCQRTI